jgi:hypothetical protein
LPDINRRELIGRAGTEPGGVIDERVEGLTDPAQQEDLPLGLAPEILYMQCRVRRG